MTRRETVVALGLVLAGVVAGAGLLAGSSQPPPASVSAPPPSINEGVSERVVDGVRAERRARDALGRLLDRTTEPRRVVTIYVEGCSRAPVADAEVTLIGAAGAVAGGRTRADGRVALDASSADVVTALASFAGHTATSLPSAADRHDINVCPGASVEGRVVDRRGRPVGDATVELGDGLDVAVTDADGEFVLTDLHLLAGRVSASARGAKGAVALAPLAEGEVRVIELVLEEVRRLTGFVVDVGGAPVGYAELVVWDGGGVSVARARSDRHGRFWLDGVPFEAVTLVAADRDGGLGQLFVGADGPRDGLVVSLEPAGRISVDFVGAFRGRFDVLALTESPPYGRRIDVAPGGTRVATLAVGEIAVLAAPRLYQVTYEEDGEPRVCGQVLLTPGASVTVRCGEARQTELVGRVVDAAGAALAEVLVMVTGDGMARITTRTDLDGGFAVWFDAPRSVPVVVVAADRARGFLPTRRRNVPVVPGEVTDIGELRLDHGDAHADLRGPGPFGGIGARLEDAPDGLLLSAIVRGGPLDRAGARSGDVVVAIGDQQSGFLPSHDAVRLLRGEPGTQVTLRLRDTAGATREVTIERSVIDVEAAGWVN